MLVLNREEETVRGRRREQSKEQREREKRRARGKNQYRQEGPCALARSLTACPAVYDWLCRRVIQSALLARGIERGTVVALCSYQSEAKEGTRNRETEEEAIRQHQQQQYHAAPFSAIPYIKLYCILYPTPSRLFFFISLIQPNVVYDVIFVLLNKLGLYNIYFFI